MGELGLDGGDEVVALGVDLVVGVKEGASFLGALVFPELDLLLGGEFVG